MKYSYSFVIPNYNSVKMLTDCIDSIYLNLPDNFDKKKLQIIVVDDGSKSNVKYELNRLANEYRYDLVDHNVNMGYTQSVNDGMKIAVNDIIVLMNNDVHFVQKEWFDIIDDLFDLNGKIGIAGCRLLYPSGLIQHGGMEYSSGIYLLRHKYVFKPSEYPDALKTHYTLAVTGALFCIRKKMADEIGYLNTEYHMTCSDTDYCIKANRAGWYVVYCGKSYAVHGESITRKKIKNKINKKWEHEDVMRFYNKHKADLMKYHIDHKI